MIPSEDVAILTVDPETLTHKDRFEDHIISPPGIRAAKLGIEDQTYVKKCQKYRESTI